MCTVLYSCHALSARFFAVDRALNFYFMIMIISHADFFRGNVRPEEKLLGEVKVEGNDALLAVD